MTKNRIASVAIALATVIVLVAGWFLGVQPQFTAAVAADDQAASVRADNAQHAAELVTLKQQFTTLPALQKQLTGLTAAVPGTIDSSSLVASIYAAASSIGVKVVGITQEDPIAYAGAAPATAEKAPAEKAGGSSSGTPISSVPAASAVPKGPAVSSLPKSMLNGAPGAVPTGSATTPTTGVVEVSAADKATLIASGFIAIPVSISASANFAQTLDFMNALQNGSRLFVITNASLAPGGDASVTIKGLVFVLAGAGSASTAVTGATGTTAAAAK